MREIAADHAGIGRGIVGLSDARHQQKLDVENRIGGEQNEIGRLLPLIARGIDKRLACGALAGAVEIDPRDPAVVACRKVGFADQRRQDGGLRRGL